MKDDWPKNRTAFCKKNIPESWCTAGRRLRRNTFLPFHVFARERELDEKGKKAKKLTGFGSIVPLKTWNVRKVGEKKLSNSIHWCTLNLKGCMFKSREGMKESLNAFPTRNMLSMTTMTSSCHNLQRNLFSFENFRSLSFRQKGVPLRFFESYERAAFLGE